MDIEQAAVTSCTAILTDGMRSEGASPGDTLDALVRINVTIVAYLVAESGMDVDRCADILAHAVRRLAPEIVALYQKSEETLQ